MKTAAVFAANLLWWLLPMASGQNKLGDFPPQVLEKLSQEMDVIQEWWCVTKGNMDEEMEAHMNPNKKEMEKMHQQYCRKFLKKEQREMSMSCVLWEERRKMIKKGGPLDL
mmetsp:Transcript_32502/g.85593  ORF Transcript_32502/g.85593 Transcript_32502/m.85593 type:complete len:111 (+) Transcript_32502:83-415(+)